MTERKAATDALHFLPVTLVAILTLALDQSTKALVLAHLSGGRVISLLGGLLYLDYARNTGAAFNLLQAHGGVFVIVALAALLGAALFYRRIARSSIWTRLAVGLIMGGAAGNLVDRLRLGYVVDFIDLRWWPVFNVADSAVVTGVLLLLLLSLAEGRAA